MIIIEIIVGIEFVVYLCWVIIKMLLMGDDLSLVDFYFDVDDIMILKEFFFYGQVVDNIGQLICWEGCVSNFVDYLLKNCLKSCSNGLCIIYSVIINMVLNYFDKCVYKYFGMVCQVLWKYGVDELLILVIMQIEFFFNLYVVSCFDVLGLMQVV